MDRRQFLKTCVGGALGTGALAARDLFAAEAAKETELVIIDTHTHFYDPTRPQGVPWPNRNEKLLYRKVMPSDYRALPKPQPVAGTVVVEASDWVEDNQWILDLAARDPFIVGFVGNLNLETEDFSQHLKHFAQNPVFRGIRVRDAALPRLLKDVVIKAKLKELVNSNLTIDVNGPPAMLSDIARLAGEFPELRIVINHLANVHIDSGPAKPEWLTGMQAAARQKNVFCKVSGLVEGSGRNDGKAPRELAFYRPVLDAVWRLFGEDRLIYGSNWPVSELFADCATVQGLVYDYFAPLGRRVLDKVFGVNAQSAYHFSPDCQRPGKW